MTETPTAEIATTPEAKATRVPKPAPAPEPPKAKLARAKHAIVRTISRGAIIDLAAIITVNVANPKINGCKAWQRWETGYESGRSVKDTLAVPGGPRLDDLRYDYERAFIDLDPAPAIPPKNTK